jgi:hypothetical protein
MACWALLGVLLMLQLYRSILLSMLLLQKVNSTPQNAEEIVKLIANGEYRLVTDDEDHWYKKHFIQNIYKIY